MQKALMARAMKTGVKSNVFPNPDVGLYEARINRPDTGEGGCEYYYEGEEPEQENPVILSNSQQRWLNRGLRLGRRIRNFRFRLLNR